MLRKVYTQNYKHGFRDTSLTLRWQIYYCPSGNGATVNYNMMSFLVRNSSGCLSRLDVQSSNYGFSWFSIKWFWQWLITHPALIGRMVDVFDDVSRIAFADPSRRCRIWWIFWTYFVLKRFDLKLFNHVVIRLRSRDVPASDDKSPGCCGCNSLSTMFNPLNTSSTNNDTIITRHKTQITTKSCSRYIWHKN